MPARLLRRTALLRLSLPDSAGPGSPLTIFPQVQLEGIAFPCYDAADYPNTFFCVTKISKRNGGAHVAECRASCDADTQIILCRHSDAQGGCPQDMRCQINVTLPPPHGYGRARGSLRTST
jgi:hypothetical protein